MAKSSTRLHSAAIVSITTINSEDVSMFSLKYRTYASHLSPLVIVSSDAVSEHIYRRICVDDHIVLVDGVAHSLAWLEYGCLNEATANLLSLIKQIASFHTKLILFGGTTPVCAEVLSCVLSSKDSRDVVSFWNENIFRKLTSGYLEHYAMIDKCSADAMKVVLDKTPKLQDYYGSSVVDLLDNNRVLNIEAFVHDETWHLVREDIIDSINRLLAPVNTAGL